MKVLCIGSSLLETTCPINAVIQENQTIRLNERTECGGGHAGNIAYLLGKWGVETYIASMLGSDDAASKIKKDFETIGVKTDYLETSFDRPTSKSLVIVNTTSKNKTVFELNSNSFLKKYSFGVDFDTIISDGNDFNASVSAFDKYSKAKSFLVVSKVDKEIIELGRYANYIIFNKGTAEGYANYQINYNDSSTIVNVYNKLRQRFTKAEIVITLGERGAVYAVDGQVKILPPVRVEIVDTNGAGDVFAGAFAYAIGRDFDLEKAVTYASIAASLSTTKMTSRLAIPALTEVSNYYNAKFAQPTMQNPAPRVNATPNQANVTPNPSTNPAPNMDTGVNMSTTPTQSPQPASNVQQQVPPQNATGQNNANK